MGTGGHGGDWRSAYSRLRVGYRCHLNVAISVWYRRRCLDRYLRKGKGKGRGGDVSSTRWKRISPPCASGLKQTFVCQDAAKVVLFSRSGLGCLESLRLSPHNVCGDRGSPRVPLLLTRNGREKERGVEEAKREREGQPRATWFRMWTPRGVVLTPPKRI